MQLAPTDAYRVTQLARLLREAGHPEQSVQLFREYPDITHNNRAFYFEWGTSEGVTGNRGLDAWLSGVAMADSTEMRLLDKETATMCLASLSLSFGALFDTYNDLIFIEACGATAQLGLMLPENLKTGKAKQIFQRNLIKSKQEGVNEIDPSNALKRLDLGLTRAWEQREAELPAWIKKKNDITFKALARLLRIDIEH